LSINPIFQLTFKKLHLILELANTYYTAGITLQHGVISWESNKKSSLSMDWFNHVGANIGNYDTSVFAGTVFRIGNNYSRNFNVKSPLLTQEASMVQLKKRNNNFGWSISS
ncbi:lipid A-modifier LpxR family protein, partial [Sulfurimonas sp.]|uniref:lipid A-modifier LpxR family protein n=1 Tax=Sulfurimonas sp. TaxID=2022749 RepID=UPI0025EFA82A